MQRVRCSCVAPSRRADAVRWHLPQSLLVALRACAPEALQPLVASRRADVSTRFMLWLAGEAAAAEARGDADAQQLETLCGLVFVARDGCAARSQAKLCVATSD